MKKSMYSVRLEDDLPGPPDDLLHFREIFIAGGSDASFDGAVGVTKARYHWRVFASDDGQVLEVAGFSVPSDDVSGRTVVPSARCWTA